jgi:replicative DNA helicase
MVAQCSYCHAQIPEGTICKNCQNKHQQPSQGGFSLTGLLKPAPSVTPQPTQQPQQPTNTTPPPIPPTIPQVPQTTQIDQPPAEHIQPAAEQLPTAQATKLNLQTPTQSPSSYTSPAQSAEPQIPQTPQISQPAQTIKPVTQQTTTPQTPSAPVSTPQRQTPPVPQEETKSQTINEKAKALKKDLDQQQRAQKELHEEVFSSDLTGMGDEELEIGILAGILKDPYILEKLTAKGLITGLFSTRYSRAIFRCIVSLRDENPELSVVDQIVIKNKMRQLNLWDTAIQDFLRKIFNNPAPLLDQVLHYLELMKEQALKRKLKEVAHNIHEFIDNPSTEEDANLETFTNRVIQNVRNIQKARTTKRINLVKEEMRGILTDIDQREVNGEVDIIGYSFEPMHYLNRAISGFRKGFMYAIAGAPRRGKTTFTLELATRVATLNKIPVLFFTYEQTKKNLTYRLLAKESRLNPDTLQRKKIRSDMIMDAKFMGGWNKMEDYMDYFYIVEATKEDTVDRIRSYAYNVMQDFNTQDIMIFVDYIQKMPLSRNYMDEKFKVEEISTELKGLSIELNNPIMTISSLSKEGCMIDATPDAERPSMYHCKGSGDLEYDLDCAMIQAKDWGDTKELFQQLQHKAEELGKDTTRIPKVDVVNLYLDKNRDAPEGIFSTIQYLFFIEDNKFVELGPKFDDDRYRFSKIEELVDKLIAENFIIFFEKPKDNAYNQGRVSIKLKNF